MPTIQYSLIRDFVILDQGPLEIKKESTKDDIKEMVNQVCQKLRNVDYQANLMRIEFVHKDKPYRFNYTVDKSFSPYGFISFVIGHMSLLD